MNNKSGLEFTDISSEKYRTYVFESGIEIKIIKPNYLNVSSNGHRILDEFNISHYIPKGWVHLYWEVEKDQPNFVK